MLGGRVCWVGFHFTHHARRDLRAVTFALTGATGASWPCRSKGSRHFLPWGRAQQGHPSLPDFGPGLRRRKLLWTQTYIPEYHTECGGGKWDPDGGRHSRRVQLVFSPGRLKGAPGGLEAGGLWTQPPSRRSWFEKCCKCDIRAYIYGARKTGAVSMLSRVPVAKMSPRRPSIWVIMHYQAARWGWEAWATKAWWDSLVSCLCRALGSSWSGDILNSLGNGLRIRWESIS